VVHPPTGRLVDIHATAGGLVDMHATAGRLSDVHAAAIGPSVGIAAAAVVVAIRIGNAGRGATQ
jgi:hypothetical protein